MLNVTLFYFKRFPQHMKAFITLFSVLFLGNFLFAQGNSIFTKGVFNGTYETTYPSGKTQVKGNFRNNNRVGDWYFYAEDGVEVAHLFYTNNLIVKTISSVNKSKIELNIADNNALLQLPISNEDVLWSKRVWRDIPSNELKLDQDRNFWNQLQILAPGVKVFQNDEFNTSYTCNLDSLQQTGKITGYRIKMDYFFRSDLNIMDARIVGICPLATNSDQSTKELGWIYYYGNQNAFDQIITSKKISLDALLASRNFQSAIIKESRADNLSVKESVYADQGESQITERIELDIIEAENRFIIAFFRN